MRSALGQVQERMPVYPMPDTTIPNVPVATLKEIPYDYVATFKLQGRRSNRVQDVINISTDGTFIASAIGYSFIPAELPPFLPIPIVNDSGVSTTSTTLAEVIAQTFLSKLSLSFPDPGDGTVSELETVKRLVTIFQPIVDPNVLMRCLQVRLCGIDFKYSIIDSGTGRELQNQPIHNIAGLGEPSGDRPFRPLAKPMLFTPRSTIRIEIEEVSEGAIYAGAQLFIVLHGYKALGNGTGLP